MSCCFIVFAGNEPRDADGILRNVFIFFPLRFSNVIFMQIKFFFDSFEACRVELAWGGFVVFVTVQ